MNNRFFVGLFICLVPAACRPTVKFVNNMEAEVDVSGYRTVWLPISENASELRLNACGAGGQASTEWLFNLADSSADYVLPFDISRYESLHFYGRSFLSPVWKQIRWSRKPVPAGNHAYVSFAPPYGWINDPNGMVYKDGVYHLFYQFNPLGAKWGNMSWGHAVSRDLVKWEHRAPALLPDSLGMIFSGSAVVDGDRIAAVYTSAGKEQVQSLAFSSDGGESFDKYSGNPVLRSELRDFRDPKVFWYEPEGKWKLILAAGDHMEIYSSSNLTDWSFESSFGEGVGLHTGVWECPDLFELHCEDRSLWMLVCSLDTGYPRFSATQYFLGSFDGHRFIPSDEEIRLLDYGTDHYAAVSWSGVPDNRRIMLAWKNNWAYANDLPTRGTRGSMTLPRELFLGDYCGRITVFSYPVKEVSEAIRAGLGGWKHTAFEFDENQCEAVLEGGAGWVLKISVHNGLMTLDRSATMNPGFSEKFQKTIDIPAPLKDKYRIDIFSGPDSAELFVDGGAIAATMLFP